MRDFDQRRFGTSADAIRTLTAVFREGCVETPERDARLLVGGHAGIDPGLALVEPRPLPHDVATRIVAAMRRRLEGEPVSRILGRRGFYGRDFAISPATLDPRPDTETVVEAALAIAAREGWRDRTIRVLDVGTGSGALLVTLLAELPSALGVGTDIDPAALEIARINAERLGVASRSTWLRARSLEGVAGPFDLLVSNPPYIPSGEIDRLDREVAQFDPRTALDGGEDGLTVYREILSRAAEIVPAGWICFEVGVGQADAVVELSQQAGLGSGAGARIFKDLAGVRRCVALQTQL